MYDPVSFKHLLPKSFVAYDFETTGLDTTVCDVVELGAIRFVDGVFDGAMTCLIKNKNPLPEETTKITGITDEMLAADGEDELQVFTQFESFIKGLPLVGHNILRYDNPILQRKLKDVLGIDWVAPECVDTAGLFKASELKIGIEDGERMQDFCLRALDKRVAGLKFNLAHAYKTLGFTEAVAAHRVEGDVQMVLEIYEKLIA